MAVCALGTACSSAPEQVPESNVVSVDGRSATPGLPSSAEPAASPTPTTTGPAIPTKSYIAVCNNSGVVFYDANSGTELASFQDLGLSAPGRSGAADTAGQEGIFRATGLPRPDSYDIFSCTNLSFDGSMTKIAGLDSYNGGDTVPASFDLVASKVSDAVPAKAYPTGGFTPPQTKSYVAAAYDPTGSGLWYAKAEGTDNAYPDGYTLTGPNGQSKAYTTPHTPAQNGAIQFLFGNPVPTFVDDDPASQLSPRDPLPTSDAQVFYAPSSGLPDTDYSVRSIRRPDSGRPGGAFLASRDGTTKLFRWDGTGSPVELADLPTATDDSQVVRWNDAA